jgi:predicted NUDIX family NTP pyrophosphohydrolase
VLAHTGGPFWRKRDAAGWTIPKGVVETGDLLAGALREFNEETSFTAREPFVPLSPVRQKSGKIVHAFAFEGDFDPSTFSSNSFELEWPPKSGRLQHFPEIDRLAWFDYDTALRKIIAYQQPFLVELRKWFAGKDTTQA